MKRNWEENNR